MPGLRPIRMSENTAPNRPVNLIAALLLVIALMGAFVIGNHVDRAAADPAPTDPVDPSVRGLVTQGTGSIDATPNQLEFTVTVSNSASQTAGAIARTGADLHKVKTALLKAGVASKDITTQNLSIQPNYDYSGSTQRITGYSASEDLSVLVRQLASAGSVISTAATVAGNSVSVGNISMTIGDTDSLMAQARAKAVAAARSAASSLAGAAGLHVGKAVYIEDVTGAGVPVDYAVPGAMSSLAAGKSIPISAGSQKVTVNVKVRWTLS
ncbi:MAG: hypothetical protein JWQ32_3157 [Marmoricola sp.]|nr:hypothetical protein [Marmoricola sp.]